MPHPIQRILDFASMQPEAIALDWGSEQVTYKELISLASKVAHCLNSAPQRSPVAIYQPKNTLAYAALIGIMASGRCYLPLGYGAPTAGLDERLNEVGAEFVIGEQSFTGKRSISANEINHQPSTDLKVAAIDENEIAYILFTSGSTGKPKAVPITLGNLAAYISAQESHYQFKPGDRLSQTFELTFDPSLHDIFLAFTSGATLCPIRTSEILWATQIIKQRKINVWYCVPSVLSILDRAGALKPNALDHVRWSLFSAEPLSVDLVEKWKVAAPNSRVENLYGPTEATINVSRYEYRGKRSGAYVPIGEPFGKNGYIFESIEEGKRGELILTGPQVSPGYLNQPGNAAFFESQQGHSYRTGDWVELEPPHIFIGRRDQQFKYRGIRVELLELEQMLEHAFPGSHSAVVRLPAKGPVADTLTAVVESAETLTDWRARCEKQFPKTLIPDQIIFIKSLPVNQNGKLDRNKLKELAESHVPNKRTIA